MQLKKWKLITKTNLVIQEVMVARPMLLNGIAGNFEDLMHKMSDKVFLSLCENNSSKGII